MPKRSDGLDAGAHRTRWEIAAWSIHTRVRSCDRLPGAVEVLVQVIGARRCRVGAGLLEVTHT